MSSLFFVRERLHQASDLAAILDAAYDAFESMLSVLRAHEDPGDPMFGAVMMAAASAADGRDAVLSAPSLPPHRLHSGGRRGETRRGGSGSRPARKPE